MTQTRVFVTYVPAARASRKAATRGRATGRSPRVAVLAGALLASGSAHSIAGADSLAPARLDVPAKLPAGAAAKFIEPAKPEALPFLTLARVEARPPAALAVSRPPPAALARAAPAPKKPASTPSRDLAGFLAAQGHQLVPISAELAAAAEPLAVEIDALGADAAAPPATLAAHLPAAGHLNDHSPQSAIAQTFPTLSVDGASLGAVTMRGDTVHLASLIGLLQLRMPAEEFARLKAAPAADSFVSLAALRAAGLNVTVDSAGERLTLAAL